MELTGIRRDVFLDRYALKDDDGKAVEASPEQMWDRVARSVAEAERPAERRKWTRRFREALDGFKFVPGGRILAGAGTGQKVTFYNCLPPDEPVLTPDGYVPISALDVRGAVITGRGRARLVTQIFTREADEPLYRIQAGHSVLRVTGEHPVLARPGGSSAAAWVLARELAAGDLVAVRGRQAAPSSDVWRVQRPEPVMAARWGGAVSTLLRESEETYQGLAWSAVGAVESRPYRGLVYDIEVEEDHSFVASGVVVSNCYVIPSPEDSRRGIMDSVALMVEIMSRGGGVGVNLSTLRPRGSYVRGVNGTASGPVSWGELYSTATGSVIQGGSRRGALMLMLDDDHPDVLEFVTVKKDLNRINNANLSVCVSDRFMEAVRADGPWNLVWNGTVQRTIRARELWELICESAWACGEPGVVFMERYQKWSNTWYCEEIRCVNPCFVGSARLATSRGLVTADELFRSQEALAVVTDARAADETAQAVGGARHVSLGVDLRPAAPVFRTGRDVPVFRLRTEHGYEVTVTREHRFLTPAGYVELQRLRPGDALYLQSGEGAWSRDDRLPESACSLEDSPKLRGRVARHEASPPVRWSREVGQLLGWLVADGYTYDRGAKPRASMVFGSREHELLPHFRGLVERWFGTRGTVVTRHNTTALHWEAAVARFVRALGVRPCRAAEKRVPEAVWSAPRDAVVGFLQGLFTADGTVNLSQTRRSCSVRLASSAPELLREVQLLLLNLGIVSRLHQRRPAGLRLMPDSRREPKAYTTAAQWELILDKENRDRFARVVGFLTASKQERVEAFIDGKERRSNHEPFTTRVASIEPAGRSDVYDTTEPQTHSVVVNGLVTHQCGEQGLGPWGVCNLGALNVAAFVVDGEVDWDGLRSTVHTAVRFLDDVIDTTEYYFRENERQQRRGIRRTGLGSMGLADMLIKLGVRYGSPEGIAFCEQLYRFIRDEAYRASALLAEEKGAFPGFDQERYLQGHFIQQLPDDVRQLIGQHGTRNGVVLTQAPTGTTSLLAGVSSGIEPVYAFSFKRTDRTGTHVVYHELFQQWLDGHVGENPPDCFVTADQLTPEEHVRMQAVIQQFVDASISKTVNAPRTHRVEDVRTLYGLAYDLGCKGVTYFRDGCRAGVLAKLDGEGSEGQSEGAGAAAAPKEKDAVGAGGAGGTGSPAWGQIHPIERPARLVGFTDRKETPLGTLFLTLNCLEGNPVELFAQIGKAGSDVSAFTEGIARLVSLALRCGVAPHEVASQLVGIGGSRSVGFGPGRIRSVPDAIGQFIRDILQELEKHPGSPVPESHAQSAAGEHGAAPRTNGSNGGLHGKGGKSGNGGGPAAALDVRSAAVEVEEALGRNVTFNLCPSCGLHTLAYIEGCALCFACGFSEC